MTFFSYYYDTMILSSHKLEGYNEKKMNFQIKIKIAKSISLYKE
jgi:hypothetical protein